MNSILHGCDSVSFIAKDLRASLDDRGEPCAPLIIGQTLFVQAQRPGRIRIEDVTINEDLAGHFAIGTSPYGLLVSDGGTRLELRKTDNTFLLHSAASTLDALTSESGLAEVLSPDVLFANKPTDAFQRAGDETLDTLSAAVYTRTHTYYGLVTEQRVYLDKQTRLPLRIAVFSREDTEPKVEIQRTNFSSWTLDPVLPATAFLAVPPPGALPESDADSTPPYLPGLQPGGLPFPLRAETVQGGEIALELLKGKVVLLDFWAMWCAPSRHEIFRVKALYDAYHAQGLEVVGISLDPEDSRPELEAYLRNNGLLWPQLHDGGEFDSPPASAYQIASIPFNLVIGRDGVIAGVNLHGEELEAAVRLGAL